MKNISPERIRYSTKIYSFVKFAIMTLYCVLTCITVIYLFKSVFFSLGKDTDAADVLSKTGSRGEEVTKIQTALNKLGYDAGKADGIFGVKTQTALIKFQRAKGLTADGIAGPVTLNSLGIYTSTGASANQNDINLLARLISAESRGEPYNGQVAVGAVVLNRVKHPSFPNSISAVIYQPQAFTCINDGQFNQPVAESAYRAARDALNNADPSSGAIYYYNPRTATSTWIRSRPVITTIGDHVFCK